MSAATALQKGVHVSEELIPVASWCALLLEAIGVVAITLSAISSLLRAGIQLLRRVSESVVYFELRQRLGLGILLGLEFLIAADIIHTVAVDFSIEAVGILAIIVFIRTFLSLTLGVELTGRWPWQGGMKMG